MTQFCCYRLWDGSHEKHRRAVLILSVIDLVLISCILVFVGISLYNVATLDPQYDGPLSRSGSTVQESDNSSSSSTEDFDNGMDSQVANQTKCGNGTEDSSAEENCPDGVLAANGVPSTKFFPNTPYFQVVGYRIAKSIQLIIYTCQLFMTVFLVRGLMRTNTHTMRTWLIVTEIITTIILLVFILYLFNDFKSETVVITSVYLVYQFIMIRTMARFIRRTEIELTQFGSIVEF